MNYRFSAVTILTLLCGLGSAEGFNSITPAERSSGWQLLFDGTTLNGWRGFRDEKPGAGWIVANGELTTPGHIGDLVTVGEFGNFELRVSWKVGKGSNSGIIYRVGLDGSGPHETGPEYQLLDNPNSNENDGLHSAGALYDVIAPDKDAIRPTGEWNDTLIVVRCSKIQHWLNGAKIVDIDLASAQGRELVARSKFRLMPNFASQLRGHITLQDHGGLVSFRDIKIRELN